MNWQIDEYPIKELSTGTELTLKVYTLKGERPGPHIHIQASVHGAEIQGNAVILKLMEELREHKLRGSISFVPLANPYASLNKHGTYTYGRYNPVTGHNWNRNYVDIIKESQFDLANFCEENSDLPWHELKLKYKQVLNDLFDNYYRKLSDSQELHDNNKVNLMLQKLAVNADGVLDLHTGPTATRYLYAAEYEAKLAKYLGMKNVLVIPDEHGGAMDEASFMPWVHLMKTLDRKILPDIESFTLEFGSEETFCLKSADKDVKGILNYLAYKGLIEKELTEYDCHYCLLKDYKTIYAPNGGLYEYFVETGEHFKKGDVLASCYQMKKIDPNNPIESAKTDILALEDGILINRCPSSNVHQGMELFQIMTNTYDNI